MGGYRRSDCEAAVIYTPPIPEEIYFLDGPGDWAIAFALGAVAACVVAIVALRIAEYFGLMD